MYYPYPVLGKEGITDSLPHYHIDRIREIDILEKRADLIYEIFVEWRDSNPLCATEQLCL